MCAVWALTDRCDWQVAALSSSWTHTDLDFQSFCLYNKQSYFPERPFYCVCAYDDVMQCFLSFYIDYTGLLA